MRKKLEAVIDWATVHGHRSGDNPARWKGRLSFVLVSPTKLHTHENHPALPYAAFPAFMAALRRRAPSPSSGALQFLILTAARSQEVREARGRTLRRLVGVFEQNPRVQRLCMSPPGTSS